MERDLVVRAQAGDHDAFDQLVFGIIDRLYSVAYRILRNGPSAEDATQQTLVAIWRQLPRLRDVDKFEAWTYRLLVNAAYAEHRRSRRVAPAGALTDGAAGADPYITVHDREQLERGFHQLSKEQRAVLVLQHYLGMSHDEMASVLEIPVGTVRSRLHGARNAMRARSKRMRDAARLGHEGSQPGRAPRCMAGRGPAVAASWTSAADGLPAHVQHACHCSPVQRSWTVSRR